MLCCFCDVWFVTCTVSPVYWCVMLLCRIRCIMLYAVPLYLLLDLYRENTTFEPDRDVYQVVIRPVHCFFNKRCVILINPKLLWWDSYAKTVANAAHFIYLILCSYFVSDELVSSWRFVALKMYMYYFNYIWS